MLSASTSFSALRTTRQCDHQVFILPSSRSRSNFVSRGNHCKADKLSLCSATAKRGSPSQKRQMHLQQQQRNGTTGSNGLITLELDGNTLRTESGHVIIQQLGQGVSLSALQQHSTAQQRPAPGLLLDVHSQAPAASDAVVGLGDVCGTAFLACARIKLCWMSPYHASSVAGLPGHMQFMLVQLAQGGPYVTILPLLPDGCKATLQPAKDQGASGNLLCVRLDSGNPDITRSSWQGAVYVAAGSDPFKLVDAAVAAAAAVAGGAKPRWEKQLPDITRWLGWCTWDAFYHSVSAQGILQGLEGFRAADPSRVPRWLIIDDGWQRTGLDHRAAQLQGSDVTQQQQQGSEVPQQQQQQGGQPPGPYRHPLPDSALPRSSSSSSSSGSYRSSMWVWKRFKKVVQSCQRALLHAVSAVADRLNWWSLLLAGLRHPLLHRPLVRLLKAYNAALSEHSKRLLSNQFNAKFSDLSTGPLPDTSSTASAAAAAAVITALKQQHNLKHIYVWHAMLGYWSGVAPAAVAAAPPAAAAAAEAVVVSSSSATGPGASSSSNSKTHVLEAATSAAAAAAAAGTANSSSSMGGSVVLPRVSAAMTDLEPPCNWSQLVLAGLGLPAAPSTFFHQLHSYLASLGIDGVKVDVQNQLELAGSAQGQAGGQVLAGHWHRALEDSAAQHFPGNNLINCMCHNTSNLYHMCATALARVSDDFYPQLPASHAPHVAVCAFNSLFMGPLLLPDWDMFHSRHPRALLHATARMISGGPVYVSDKPGSHDPQLLARLALPGGLLLQPLLPGRPTRDCLFVDPCRDGSSMLKVWNLNPCNGVVAVFNVQGSGWSRSRLRFVTHDSNPPTLAAVVKPHDVEGLDRAVGSVLTGISSSSSTAPFMLPTKQSGHTNSGTPTAAAGGALLQHTGAFVMYQDSSSTFRVLSLDGSDDTENPSTGVQVTLEPAGSDVVTVAPLLALLDSSTDDNGHSSSSSGSVLFAAVGLVNMLNPGGAVRGIKVIGTDAGGNSSSSSDSRARRGTSSSSGSSGSDSWVVTDTAEAAAAAAGDSQDAVVTATKAAPNGNDTSGNVPGPAAAVLAAAGSAGAGLSSSAAAAAICVSVLGCGQLLLYASCKPVTLMVDGQSVDFGYDSRTGSLTVEIPEAAGAGSPTERHTAEDDIRGLEHDVVVVLNERGA